MTVSRETLAAPRSPSYGRVRDRAIDGRIRKGLATRERIVDAVLAAVGRGNFRPTNREVARAAGVTPPAVIKHFGSLDLLYRVIAREHPAEVVAAAGIEAPGGAPGGRALAWTIMVGKPRGLS